MGKTQSAPISIIDAQIFQDAFLEWTKTVWEAAQGQVAAIVYKTVRRSANKANGESPIHVAGVRERRLARTGQNRRPFQRNNRHP